MSSFLIFLCIYVVIGIVFNFCGPFIRDLRNVLSELKHRVVQGNIDNPCRVGKRWLVFLLETILRLLIVVLWFPAVVICLVEYSVYPERYGKGEKTAVTTADKKEPGLYFQTMGGHGSITCLICGYTEEVTAFIHGFGENRWSRTGYQCRQCGKFHGIERHQNEHFDESTLRCDCGGQLSRDHVIFCPRCRLTSIEYHMIYIT